MEVWTNGGGFGTSGCESDCELGCDPEFCEFCQSFRVPRMATFFHCLPVAILFEPDLRRWSVLPLFSVLIKRLNECTVI